MKTAVTKNLFVYSERQALPLEHNKLRERIKALSLHSHHRLKLQFRLTDLTTRLIRLEVNEWMEK